MHVHVYTRDQVQCTLCMYCMYIYCKRTIYSTCHVQYGTYTVYMERPGPMQVNTCKRQYVLIYKVALKAMLVSLYHCKGLVRR